MAVEVPPDAKAGVARTAEERGELLWRQVEELAGQLRLVEEERGSEVEMEVGPFAVLFDDSEEAEEALMEALAFSDLYEVLAVPGGAEEVRRTGHPEAGFVLDVAGRVLDSPVAARAARKAALKARTLRVCG
ncbi:hypothetical protein BIV57_03085 [Mangrovactinospora gilvigrisea]|uniref:Uncharacterized protein n=1 Tax=Mangrovactinospora gilvigrisea TaxID=1428644 RepID=A0A1J7BK39_9ACTN|nr:hypothetical protein BIV57_03085 [Mangrovactinospora gilvigrisea]